jgi:hypothetical protein
MMMKCRVAGLAEKAVDVRINQNPRYIVFNQIRRKIKGLESQMQMNLTNMQFSQQTNEHVSDCLEPET